MVGWYVGAAINLVGSICINLGTNVMKLGFNKRELLDMPEDQKPSIRRFREWQIGMVIFIVGNVLNFASFSFAAQSLLAALGSIQFVSNVFFAYFMLKEKVTWLTIIATGCIVGGCIMLVIFGNHSSSTYTVDQLLDLYKEPAYIVYLTMAGVFVFGSYIVYMHGKRQCALNRKSKWGQILPVAYSIFSALLGTQSVLFSKCLSVLLRETIAGNNQLTQWFTWVVLPLFLFTAIFWVTRLNKGLRQFPAMIIVPLMQIAWTLFSIVSGMLYFQEYKTFTVLSAVMFVVGVLTVFVGVYLLTKSGAQKMDSTAKTSELAEDKVEMHDNIIFNPDENDPDVPKKEVGIDTLRFTSLGSTMRATEVKHMMKIETLRRQKKLDLNGTANSSLGIPELKHAPTVAESHASEAGGGSLMGTLKDKSKELGKELQQDMGFGKEDATNAFKQTFGFGRDARVPAWSLFSMPGVDLMGSGGGPRRASNYASSAASGPEMLTELPQSRFFKDSKQQQADTNAQHGLSTIVEQETSGLTDDSRHTSRQPSMTAPGPGQAALQSNAPPSRSHSNASSAQDRERRERRRPSPINVMYENPSLDSQHIVMIGRGEEEMSRGIGRSGKTVTLAVPPSHSRNGSGQLSGEGSVIVHDGGNVSQLSYAMAPSHSRNNSAAARLSPVNSMAQRSDSHAELLAYNYYGNSAAYSSPVQMQPSLPVPMQPSLHYSPAMVRHPSAGGSIASMSGMMPVMPATAPTYPAQAAIPAAYSMQPQVSMQHSRSPSIGSYAAMLVGWSAQPAILAQHPAMTRIQNAGPQPVAYVAPGLPGGYDPTPQPVYGVPPTAGQYGTLAQSRSTGLSVSRSWNAHRPPNGYR